MKLLVDSGADVNVQMNVTGMAPLHFAAMRGRLDSVYWLIKNGANVNLLDK